MFFNKQLLISLLYLCSKLLKMEDYNTQRKKLVMPEYGRYIHDMIDYVKSIEDRDKRNEQIQAVVSAMGVLNPHVKDISDFKHKIWDHVYLMSGFELDIDSPFEPPQKDKFLAKPNKLKLNTKPIKATCYGRNIENIINVVADMEDSEQKIEIIRNLGIYMRQQYLIWNKDNVSQETIFQDMERLSDGRLKVPEGVNLGSISGNSSQFKRPGLTNLDVSSNNKQKQKNKGKKWKKN